MSEPRATDLSTDQDCRNCGNVFHGNYCNLCGEQAYVEQKKAMSHFLHESFHFITHIDSKFFRSWWLLMTRPAFLSTEICRGVKKKYFKPVNLFLIGVVLYLLFPFFQGLNVPLENHLSETYAPATRYLVDRKMNSKHLTYQELEKKFNDKSPKFAKVLLLLIIPLAGLVLSILFFRKRAYFYDHLMLAAELNTFYLYFTFFIIPLMFTIFVLARELVGVRGNVDIGDNITMPLYSIVFGAYSSLAFRRFYGVKWWWSTLMAVLFVVAHAFIVYTIYRLILMAIVLLFI